METIPREALGIDEAAHAAGISRAKLYELLADGDGPRTLKVGRRRLIRVGALREWLEDREGRGDASSG